MAELNPRALRQSDCCRVLNSNTAGLGTVVTERRLHGWRVAAGLAIGTRDRIDLLRLQAWLFHRRREQLQAGGPQTYEEKKAAAAARQRALSKAGREIGPLPAVKNPKRKAAALASLQVFAETYFPERFYLEWSPDQKKVLARMERTIRKGGLFAMAMARGDGKTTLCEVAVIWATLTGLRRYVVLFGATDQHASDMLDSIKTELEGNELLTEDFPEVCHPIIALEGIINRTRAQLCDGVRTEIQWTADLVVLPTIAGSAASSAIIRTKGITASFRGMKFTRPDGKSVRPDLVFLDDPQTDESAKSPSQSADRLRILNGAVLGLAGPKQKIAGFMPCTVIREGDMADQILNRDQNPVWNGERMKMVYSFPKRTDLWDKYRELRNNGMRDGDEGEAANAFYLANLEAMDEGAKVAWESRYNADEHSALQHAMNLMYRDRASFFAEYQNEPIPDRETETDDLTVDLIANKINRRARGSVPLAASKVTAFIDVHKRALVWAVCAWENVFTGYVIDYGVYPPQTASHFSLPDVRRTLQWAFPGTMMEGWIYQGLEKLADILLPKPYVREGDGAVMKIERCPIDANWGESTETVKKFCRQSKFASVVVPSFGRYIGASGRPMHEWVKHTGDEVGNNWRVPKVTTRGEVRHLLFDANFWKSRAARALLTKQGDRGCVDLFGSEPNDHLLFAEHCTAEFPVRTFGRGRELTEWSTRPGRDNHWWDCLVGNFVAASMLGCEAEGDAKPPEKKKPLSLAQLQQQHRRRGP